MRVGQLSIEATQDREALKLVLKGKSADVDPEAAFGGFLADQQRRARALRVRVDLHLEALEFFNSATISLLIDFIQMLRRERVPVRVSYAENGRWQRIFFDALRMLEAPGILELVKVAG